MASTENEDGFRPLFNGRDLTGWVDVNCASSPCTRPPTFSAHNGMIICTGVPTGILRTDRMYENFIAELEWRHLIPGGNAGFFVWADPIPSRGVPFARGIEVQVLDGPNGDWYTTHGDVFPIHGASMQPDNPGRAGGRAYPTEHRSRPSPQWNHYRIEAVDGRISLAVNGRVVTTGAQCSPRRGYLCLESEGGLVHWRNLRIKELPIGPNPASPAQTALQGHPWRTLYTGVDLTHWHPAAGWQARDWTLLRTAAASSSLRTQESFSSFDLMADVRMPQRGKAVLSVGSSGTSVEFGGPGARPGEWVRIEMRRRGGECQVLHNGSRAPSIAPGTGPQPLSLDADGAAEWAGILLLKR
jgi:hypothetical protein